MCTSMTTLTQTWMTLLFSNVLPSDHNSDLPLPKCQLVYAILTRMNIHVAQVIADAIYLFAGMAPTKHPLDPDKTNRALGFPALITGLCQSYGVLVTPSKVIRPLITRPSLRSTACLGRRRVMHIRPQTHRHQLGRPIQLGHWAWSVIYSIWFASRQPTTVGRCRYMSVSTGSVSVSRGRVPPLLHALLQSSLGLRSHGLETGLMPRQGRSLQDPPVSQMSPIWMKI